MRTRDPGITEKEYLTVVFCKTASLIAAAAETGAVLAGADPATRKAMFGFGRSVGTAFQLVDDILDVTGTEKSLGKRPLQDLREGKATLPLLHALREAGAADRERARRVLAQKEPRTATSPSSPAWWPATTGSDTRPPGRGSTSGAGSGTSPSCPIRRPGPP